VGVAFVLLSLVLAVGFEVFATGMRRAGDLEDRSRALAIAQSKLEAAGTEDAFAPGETRGDSEDGRFHWAVSITPSDEGQDPARPVQAMFMLYRVDVRVDWQAADARDLSVTLATLGLGQRK
jgi:general secretion pathway protein I